MVRNFFINGIKDERVKVAKKKGEQFIIIYFIVEKKRGFFWDKEYIEGYVILPDPMKELKIVKLADFDKVPYENTYPHKINVIDFDKLNIPSLIIDVHKNYTDRLDVMNNLHQFSDIINDWNKKIEEQIKGISEVEITE